MFSATKGATMSDETTELIYSLDQIISESGNELGKLRAELASVKAERDDAHTTLEIRRVEMDRLAQERDALRVALENARHALVTLNGLGAFDRNASPYQDALREGLDADDAHDCFMEDTWTLDESNVIAEIDAALAAKG